MNGRPPPINRLPVGLLGFLGIKNGGAYPQALGADLAGTFELQNWYMQTNSQSIQLNGNVSALGFNANWWTVPNGETWAIHNCFVNSQAVLTAGQTLGCVGAWIRSALQVLPATLTELPPLATGSASVMVAAKSDITPIFVAPGGVIGVYAYTLTGGPILTTMTLTYVPIPL